MADISEEGTCWKLDFLSGELCYIQHAKTSKLPMCNEFNHIKMTQDFGDWQVWRFAESGENGNFRISSWTHYRQVLACCHDGEVTMSESRWNKGTLWHTERTADGFDGVLLTSVCCGKMLHSNGNALSLKNTFDGLSTTWCLRAGHRQKYHISPSRKRNQSLVVSKPFFCPSAVTLSGGPPQPLVWACWQLEQLDNNLVALRSEGSGKYLRYSSSGPDLQDYHGEIEEACMWRLIASEQGVSIVSVSNPCLALSLGNRGRLKFVANPGAQGSWIFKPITPHQCPKHKHFLLVGGAVAALLLGPVALATEEAAGVFVGLGMFAVASGASAATYKLTTSSGSTQEPSAQNRPFYAWRSW